MKKVFISLMIGLAMVAMVAIPALAQAQKTDLAKTSPELPGGGFVVCNGPAGNNQFVLELALKGVQPNKAYDVYLDIPLLGIPPLWWNLGPITTNNGGNASLHHNCPVSDTIVPLPAGPYDIGVNVTLAGSLDVLYSMSGTVMIK